MGPKPVSDAFFKGSWAFTYCNLILKPVRTRPWARTWHTFSDMLHMSQRIFLFRNKSSFLHIRGRVNCAQIASDLSYFFLVILFVLNLGRTGQRNMQAMKGTESISHPSILKNTSSMHLPVINTVRRPRDAWPLFILKENKTSSLKSFCHILIGVWEHYMVTSTTVPYW